MLDNPMLKSFCQRDPAWAALTLKPSKLTVGRFGCTTCCIADLASYFGDINITPAELVGQTADIPGLVKYTSGGLILWQSCNFKNFQFERREQGRHDDQIIKALNDPNRAVILEVAHGSHWVVCIGINSNKQYRIADPWLGDKAVITRYQNNITGAAYFKRK